jgi:anthranilate synthase component 1
MLQALADAWPEEFPVLFDSAASGALGRWSILAAFPRQRLLRMPDGAVTRDAGAGLESVACSAGFLDELETAWKAERREPPAPAPAAQRDQPNDASVLPFRGGWVVYLSYEMAAEVEPTLQLPVAIDGPPLAVALRVSAAIVYDHHQGRARSVAEGDSPELLDAIDARLAALQSRRHGRGESGPEPGPPVDVTLLVEDDPATFEAAVQAAQAYIRAGDIYQANLSRRWRVPMSTPASGSGLYGSLRRANPAPFAAWAQLPGLQLLSSSPERLVSVRGDRIETRPIAGTRPRLQDSQRELAALLASSKERAEHIMLIDLERSDLGRVCQAGSVVVDELMVTESYAHVHHIVSSVRGRLRADVTPVAVLRALFPGGTITGCPKYRCMQIIAELEQAPRGAYTGSLGYINLDGSMDFNILIRTLTLYDSVLEFRAGAGIVADSDCLHELAETRAKALGMMRALGARSAA